jgi:hypothetical protein
MGGEREVIFEFHTFGNATKVSAFDVATMTEISVMGATGVGQEVLKRLALRKLEYVLRRKSDRKPSR